MNATEMSVNRTATFGVVGGYGATGRAVVSELAKSCGEPILIGGRNLDKGKALAAELGSRISVAHLDVLDDRSLHEFCGQCSTVVNCAGPVIVLQDRVARAAVRQGCHYIDAAGMSLVKERLLPHSRELAELQLSFVISAGWMPGISELLPAYADAVASGKMRAIESLTVYFGDCGEWSDNALRDGVWYIHERGLRRPSYFHKGEWTRARTLAAMRTVNLGKTLGAGRFCMFATPEIEEFGRRCKGYDVFTYTCLAGVRTALVTTLMALIPLPEKFGVRLLRNVFRGNRLPLGGFVAVQVLGQAPEPKPALTVQIVFQPQRDYWINGLVLATAARLASARQGVKAGVHFLADAVDPVAFMVELRNAGLETSESFEPGE
jgi:saccharopine dehydrogenase (NAD+, L-lysine-forming)